MLFENTVKLNRGNLQICFNAAEDIQYLARAWLQQATATVLTLVLLPEVLLLENDLKNNYSWSTWCDYLKIRVNFTELRRKTLTERNVSKWSMVLGQTLYSIPAIFTDTSVLFGDEIKSISFENTIKLNWGDLQNCFNAAEDILYLAKAAWL